MLALILAAAAATAQSAVLDLARLHDQQRQPLPPRLSIPRPVGPQTEAVPITEELPPPRPMPVSRPNRRI